jgi:hypothetical protein
MIRFPETAETAPADGHITRGVGTIPWCGSVCACIVIMSETKNSFATKLEKGDSPLSVERRCQSDGTETS